jgi:hypothetical protein
LGTHLLLAQIVRQVGNHNLGLGRNTILGRSALLLGTDTGLAGGFTSLGGRNDIILVGNLRERSSLARSSSRLLFSDLGLSGLV